MTYVPTFKSNNILRVTLRRVKPAYEEEEKNSTSMCCIAKDQDYNVVTLKWLN